MGKVSGVHALLIFKVKNHSQTAFSFSCMCILIEKFINLSDIDFSSVGIRLSPSRG